MGIASGFVVFTIIWWTVFFAVLPWGVRPTGNRGTGEDPGAPQRPRLIRKAIVTTGITAVIWGAFFILQRMDVFSFRDGL